MRAMKYFASHLGQPVAQEDPRGVDHLIAASCAFLLFGMLQTIGAFFTAGADFVGARA